MYGIGITPFCPCMWIFKISEWLTSWYTGHRSMASRHCGFFCELSHLVFLRIYLYTDHMNSGGFHELILCYFLNCSRKVKAKGHFSHMNDLTPMCLWIFKLLFSLNNLVHWSHRVWFLATVDFFVNFQASQMFKCFCTLTTQKLVFSRVILHVNF